MFLFCMEQDQVLLQEYGFQEKKNYEITWNFTSKKKSNYKPI